MARGKGKNQPQDNPRYQSFVKQTQDAAAAQKAAQLDAAYQQSRRPITPTMTSLKDAKRLDYRPGRSAGEDWSK